MVRCRDSLDGAVSSERSFNSLSTIYSQFIRTKTGFEPAIYSLKRKTRALYSHDNGCQRGNERVLPVSNIIQNVRFYTIQPIITAIYRYEADKVEQLFFHVKSGIRKIACLKIRRCNKTTTHFSKTHLTSKSPDLN
jgi:hypothetical protein